MKSLILSSILSLTVVFTNAQTTAIPLSGVDCNGVNHDLFQDLDAGKAVVLFFFMANCGSCPPPAQKIQMMANNIMETRPGMVTGYALPFTNSTTCAYTASWVSNNNLSLFAPIDSGAAQVAHYGGFGMPTVVLLGGSDHRVMFSTLSFSTSDTTIMRDSILNLLDGTTGINNLNVSQSSIKVYPNPASDLLSINVDLKNESDVVIEMTDLTGKSVGIISTGKVAAGVLNKEFSTAGLPSGNYLLRTTVNGMLTTQKFTIIH